MLTKAKEKDGCRLLDVEMWVLFDFLHDFYILFMERFWQDKHFLEDSLLSHSFSTCTTCSWLGFSGALEFLKWLWKLFQTDRRQHRPSGDIEGLHLIVTWYGSQTCAPKTSLLWKMPSFLSCKTVRCGFRSDRIAATFVKELRNKTML